MPRPNPAHRNLLWLIVAALGCTSHPPYDLQAPGVADRAEIAAIRADVESQRRHIEAFFAAPFPRRFTVRVFPDRDALTAHWRAAWRQPDFQAQCWMVGNGLADEFSLLSPSRWRDQACEHDPADRAGLRRLISHELVHTYHSQINPRLADDATAEAVGWFIEGLATYVSGQLDDGHLAPASEAITRGKAPTELAHAFEGKYCYGVTGSLVAYIDRTRGRATLNRLLRAASQAEILAALGTTEADLLTAWRASVK
jgi:hypothetical protein